MNSHQRADLDRHITGNYGENQFRDEEDTMSKEEALDCLRQVAHLMSDGELAIRSTEDFEEALGVAIAALSSCACGGKPPLFKFSGLDLVYSPYDERHWLKLGLLLERGNEDINDCDLLIMPKGTIKWGDALPTEEGRHEQG